MQCHDSFLGRHYFESYLLPAVGSNRFVVSKAAQRWLTIKKSVVYFIVRLVCAWSFFATSIIPALGFAHLVSPSNPTFSGFPVQRRASPPYKRKVLVSLFVFEDWQSQRTLNSTSTPFETEAFTPQRTRRARDLVHDALSLGRGALSKQLL